MNVETLNRADHIYRRARCYKSLKKDLEEGAELSITISAKEVKYCCPIDETFISTMIKVLGEEIKILEKEFKEL